ncbi:serine esterase, partial [Mycobacteroides abscessus subsp. abscessus]|nr:serine esterase [Mycobacteroides abscessus subsp. abscessus]
DGAADTVVQRLVALLGHRCKGADGQSTDSATTCSPTA